MKIMLIIERVLGQEGREMFNVLRVYGTASD